MEKENRLIIPSGEDIVNIHDYLVGAYDGLPGMYSDPSYVSDVCNAHLSEEGIVPVAGFMLSRLAKGHYFMDANKRTAYFASKYFMLRNGYDFNGHIPEEIIGELNRIVELDHASSEEYARNLVERDIVSQNFSLDSLPTFERLVLKSIAVSDGLSKA